MPRPESPRQRRSRLGVIILAAAITVIDPICTGLLDEIGRRLIEVPQLSALTAQLLISVERAIEYLSGSPPTSSRPTAGRHALLHSHESNIAMNKHEAPDFSVTRSWRHSPGPNDAE